MNATDQGIKEISRMLLDVSFDFSMDSPHYWDHFWETDGGLGVGGRDRKSVV